MDAAVEAGADVRHRVRLADLVRGAGGRVEGAVLQDADGGERTVRAGIVIGADGLRSTVASLVGAPVTRQGRHAAASVYGYWSGLDVDGYHWHWGPATAAGAIPTNGGEVLVFAGVSAQRFADEVRADVPRGYRRILAEAAPELAERLAGARLAGPSTASPATRASCAGRGARAGRSSATPPTSRTRSPPTASATRCATPSCSPRRRRGGTAAAFADYEARATSPRSPLFDVTEVIASLEWDNAGLKRLHQSLSDAMKREVQALVELSHRRAPRAGPPQRLTPKGDDMAATDVWVQGMPRVGQKAERSRLVRAGRTSISSPR